MKYQLNVVTPLGTLVSEEYDSDMCSMDEITAMQIGEFTESDFFGFVSNSGEVCVLNRDVLKNSILLIKTLDGEEK